MTDIRSVQIRFVQGTRHKKSLTVVLPSNFCSQLGIQKGDLLVIRVKDNKQMTFDKGFVGLEKE
jgi:hypothetical protein